jgi:hypothetical protein
MGSHGDVKKQNRHTFQIVFRLVVLALAVTAVVKELRLPPEQRTWNGVVVGFVPYELRMPTVQRWRERVWNPDSPKLIGPKVFGIGWTLNIGRAVALVRERIAAAR